MTQKQLRNAAVEGFKESLQLANDLVIGLIRAPVQIVNSFVHQDDSRFSKHREHSEKSDADSKALSGD